MEIKCTIREEGHTLAVSHHQVVQCTSSIKDGKVSCVIELIQSTGRFYIIDTVIPDSIKTKTIATILALKTVLPHVEGKIVVACVDPMFHQILDSAPKWCGQQGPYDRAISEFNQMIKSRGIILTDNKTVRIK